MVLNLNINNDKITNNLLCMFSLLIECDLLLDIISCLSKSTLKSILSGILFYSFIIVFLK